MLEETHERFLDAIFYALQPERYGGLSDFGVTPVFAGAGEVASSAWVATILACHGWMGGMMPDECQAEIWEHDPQTLAHHFWRQGQRLNVGAKNF